VRVQGYGAEQLLWQNQGEAVYTALRLSDGLHVTAKVYDRALCEQAQGRLEYEYAALRDPGSSGLVAALALVDEGEQRTLIFGRPTGTPLLDAIRGPVELPQLLDFGRQAVSALAALHQRRLTHRHLRPRAFTFDAQSGRVTLTDLGFSLGQDRAARDLQRPTALQESLPYASPEQTGRTARCLDRRSDLYSLGVVLYELASGQRPFTGSDALELIHAHLAQKPVSLAEHRRDLPSVVASIIDRLLSNRPIRVWNRGRSMLSS
jgi:serine/threonine protein kinase